MERRRQVAQRALTKPSAVMTQRDRLIERIGVRYANCSIDTYRVTNEIQKKAITRLQGYFASMRENVEAGHSLIFYGPCGTGKDHLLAAAMFEACAKGLQVYWANGLDWYGRVRDDIERTEQMIDTLVRPTILAISDPVPPAVDGGKADGELSAWRIELLQRVVDARYRAMKPIWITINVTGIQGLRDRLSTPLADRLLHGAYGIQIAGETARLPSSDKGGG